MLVAADQILVRFHRVQVRGLDLGLPLGAVSEFDFA